MYCINQSTERLFVKVVCGLGHVLLFTSPTHLNEFSICYLNEFLNFKLFEISQKSVLRLVSVKLK